LAETISKQWSKLPEQTKQALMAFKVEDQPDVQFLKAVRELGHYPLRFENTDTEKTTNDNSLAKRIGKHWSQLNTEAQEGNSWTICRFIHIHMPQLWNKALDAKQLRM
jgi:hypothetical protein